MVAAYWAFDFPPGPQHSAVHSLCIHVRLQTFQPCKERMVVDSRRLVEEIIDNSTW